jgi:acetyltransferase-like isoleucine patch superfamily enzyme
MDRSFIGVGATIIQGDSSSYRYIGKDSVLGIGSTLITNLPDNETYAGNPAKIIDKNH